MYRLSASFPTAYLRYFQVDRGYKMISRRNKGFVKVIKNVKMFGSVSSAKTHYLNSSDVTLKEAFRNSLSMYSFLRETRK